MNINDLTIGQAKELANMIGGGGEAGSPFKVGQNYMWRTITHIHIGTVTAIHGDLISTKDACWVADTGLFTTFLAEGEISEVELFSGASGVNIGALVDWCEWSHGVVSSRK